MPRRTNPFQRLILLISRQVHADAVVTESAMLKDRLTDYETEVDVLIEADVQGISVHFGVECTAEARPATVEWVREMIAKHENLDVDKTILVSKAGYTAQAEALARAKNVLPLTLDEAESGDWAAFVGGLGNLKLAFTDLHADQVQVTLEGDQLPGGLNLDGALRKQGHDGPLKVREYFESLIQRQDLFEQTLRAWLAQPIGQRPSEFTFRVDSSPQSLIEIQAGDGTWKRVKSFGMDVRVKVIETPLGLIPQRFLGRQVAHATVPNVFQSDAKGPEEVVINLIGDETGLLKSGMLVPNSDGDPRYVEMVRPNGNYPTPKEE